MKRKVYPNACRYKAPRWFIKTGEFRAPRKGEYYLSGAIPEVYDAVSDLNQDFDIVKPCASEVVIEGIVYVLKPDQR